MTVLGFVAIAAVVIAALKIGYWYALKAWMTAEPRANETYDLTTSDGWTIKLFRYTNRGEPGPPILLCHGFAGNHWSFALPDGDSLVDHFVDMGFDCWAIDLRGNRLSRPPEGRSRRSATFDEFVEYDIPEAIALIRETTGYSQVHWIGHSMGGFLLCAYEALHGSWAIASGAIVGAPPSPDHDVGKHQGRLYRVIRIWPWLCEVIERGGAPWFGWIRPELNLVPINWKNLHPRIGAQAFYNIGELPAPPVAEKMIELVQYQYLTLDDGEIDVIRHFRRIQTPLLVAAGIDDRVSRIEYVRSFYDGLPGNDKRFLGLSKAAGCREDYGHVDILYGRNAKEELYEPIAGWFREHPATTGASARRREPAGKPVPGPTPERARLKAEPAVAMAGEAATQAVAAQPDSIEPQPVASGKADNKPWERVLADAANVLDTLEEKGVIAGDGEKSTGATRRPAAKVARVGKSATPKRKMAPGSRKTRSTKAPKKTSSKKKPAASKRKAKPRKEAASRKVSTQKATKKKTSAKRKTAQKKKTTAKKKPAKRKTAKKKKSSAKKQQGTARKKRAQKKSKK